MNRLIERLRGQFEQLLEQYDGILNRCADETRDPTELEAANLVSLRAEMEPLSDRLVQLRADDDRRMLALTALTNYPDPGALPGAGTGRAPVVQVRSEPAIYRRDGGASFFADLFQAQMSADVEARSRLDKHDVMTRAASDTAQGAGNIPPDWLIEEYAPIAHAARPLADTIRRVPITNANPVTMGVQGPPPNAVVANQTAENAPVADGSFTSTPLVVVPQTKAGKVDVSRQLMDGSNPAVDGLIYTDLMGAYAENIEQMVWTAINALAAGAIAGNVPIDLDTDQIPDGIIDASTLVRTGRRSPPTVFVCAETLWGTLNKQKDLAGRPLIVSGWSGPQNARGIGDAVTYGHVAGQVVGLPSVPSWAANDTIAYVLKADDHLLLESTTMQFRYEEVQGPETIRLGVWGYAAVVLGRYPRSIARITVTGTLPLSAPAPRTLPTVSGGSGGSAKK